MKKLWIMFTTLCITLLITTNTVIAYDNKTTIMTKLQGQWYDIGGNVNISILQNNFNQRLVTNITDLAGGGSTFVGTFHFADYNNPPQLKFIAENITQNNFHAHLILKSNSHWGGIEEQLLLRDKTPSTVERVSNLGLDSPSMDIIVKHGKPDSIYFERNTEVWHYNSLNTDFIIRYNRIYAIRLYQNGLAFDTTGLSADSDLNEYHIKYNLDSVPNTKRITGYSIGHGEFLWFNDYPHSITLNMSSH